MKQLIFLAALVTSGLAMAQTYVPGYIKSDGTYVQGHYKSAPNDTKIDNYSTKGNYNPYTGKAGTVDPYREPAIYKPEPLKPLPAPRHNCVRSIYDGRCL